MANYKKQYIDETIKESLDYIGAVIIVCPNWYGKTTTAKQFTNSFKELQNPIKGSSYLELAETDPVELLNDTPPVLIDEWQLAPNLWNTVRYLVDKTEKTGQYILTGSNSIDKDKIKHSGVRHIKRLLIRPMSLHESGESNGKISLKELFSNPNLNINSIESDMSLTDIIFASYRGGWPDIFNKKNRQKQIIDCKRLY